MVEKWKDTEGDILFEWDLDVIKDSVERETTRKEFKKANKYDADIELRI